jgi:hypothetical protein
MTGRLPRFWSIADCIEPDVVPNIVAGLYLMQTLQPSRFKTNSRRSSDDTFDFALGNALKRVAGANRRWTNTPGRRMKCSQRELDRKTRLRLAELIRAAFGSVGIYLARIEDNRLTDAKGREAAFKSALANLS